MFERVFPNSPVLFLIIAPYFCQKSTIEDVQLPQAHIGMQNLRIPISLGQDAVLGH